MAKKTWVVLISCGLFVIGCTTFCIGQRNRYNIVSRKELLSIRKQLNRLNAQERQDLSYFMDQLVLLNQFSYTLVGDKPMSIASIIAEDTKDLLPRDRKALKNPKIQALRQGYRVWKKYQSLFSQKKHILIDYSFLERGKRELALICPKLCRAIIQKNLTDFQEILRKPYSVEDVFEILTHPEHKAFHTLIDHTRLIGILLGFGRTNAHLYEVYRGGPSRSIVGHQRSKHDPLQMFSNQHPFPGSQLSPDFACNPISDETQELKNHYKQAAKTIYWTYFLRNKLEVTLALFTKKESS